MERHYFLEYFLERLDNLLFAGVAQLVEHHLAKVDVEGSNPFARSILKDEFLLHFIFNFRFAGNNR